MTDQTPTFTEMDDADAARLARGLRTDQPSAGDSLWASYRGAQWAILRNSYRITCVAVLKDGQWLNRTYSIPAAFEAVEPS